MNCAAVEWALAQKAPSSSAKLLLIAIASRIEDGVLRASQAELGRIVQLCDRSVRTALKQLETAKLITRTANPGHGDGRMTDSISLRQPEEGTQPEEFAAGKTGQPEDVSGATGKSLRGKRKILPQQPENSSGGQPEDASFEPVDNGSGACIGTGTRAQTQLTNTTTSELYPERDHQASPPLAREGSPKFLNGSAKGMLAHELSTRLIEIVGNPAWLDPRSASLAKTCREVRQWVDDGADFDEDIVPTVIDECRRKDEQIQSFRFFTNAVRRAAATRMAYAQQARNPILPLEIKDDRQPPSNPTPHIRRECISSLTAARRQRRAQRDAEREPIDLGRLDSHRIG